MVVGALSCKVTDVVCSASTARGSSVDGAQEFSCIIDKWA